MKTIRLFILLLAAGLGLGTCLATTVIPPSFDELVEQAQVIFQGTVTDVQSQWTGDGSQRRIVSDVTFQIEDPIKGTTSATYTLRMLGGTVGAESMGIADAPTFRVGDRDILFVENNGTQFIPLVGIMYGRFRVRTDTATGKELVANNEGQPVGGLANLGAAEFKTAIRAKLGTLTR
jgi:hypothetical protein